MLLGTLTSLFAAAWKFVTKGADKPEDRPLMRLQALTAKIRKASNETELAEAEERIDDVLRGELEKYCRWRCRGLLKLPRSGWPTHRLEHLIAQRRETLNGKICRRESESGYLI